MQSIVSKKLFFIIAVTFLIPALFLEPLYAEDDANVPIQITGDSVEYFYEKERAVASGNVQISYKGSLLTADEVQVDLAKKEATASGNVTLSQDGAIFTGDHVVVDLETKSAEIADMTATLAPHFYAKGSRVNKVGDSHYQIKDGYITTCDKSYCEGDKTPPYRIQAKEVLYYPDDRVVIRHAVLYVERFPIFYIPVIVIPVWDIDRFPIEVQAGRKKEWGAYVLTRTRYGLSPDFKGNILFDVRENQGLAGGFENFYDTRDYGQGALRYYFANDRCGTNDLECSRGSGHLVDESSRYRAQLRHRWKISPDLGLNAEINKLSDEFIVQDFFSQSEFERNAFPDNYVSLIQSKDDYTVSALGRWRLDDFVGVTERKPEISFDTHTHAIEGTNFYYRQEVDAAHLKLKFKDDTDEARQASRVDIRSKFSYVWRVQPWTVTPYIASRETYYSRDADADRDFVRWNLEAGVDLSTKFFKVYDVDIHSWGLDINKIRHIFTPNISYGFQSDPTHTKQSLVTFDEVDELERDNFLRLDFENKLQTKSKGGKGKLSPRTLLRSIVTADFKFLRSERAGIDTLRFDTDFNPYRWLTLSSDAEYRYESDQFEFINVDVTWNRDRVWVGLGQRYVNGDSNQTTAQLDLKINDDLSLRLYERFEFSSAETDEFEASLQIRNFVCWTAQLTYNCRNEGGGSFYVSFAPTDFTESAFHPGQYYRRSGANNPASGFFAGRAE